MATRDVSDQLYEGESVERSVTVGDGEVVITDRRVLVFTPDTPGKNFRHAERPNVVGARVRTASNRRFLNWGGVSLVLAVAFIAGGRMLNPGGMFGSMETGRGASALGTGGVVGAFRNVIELLKLVDDVLLGMGVVFLVATAVTAALYVRSRHRVLTVEIAGEDDVDMAAEGLPDADDAAERIRRTLDLELSSEEGEGPSWRT